MRYSVFKLLTQAAVMSWTMWAKSCLSEQTGGPFVDEIAVTFLAAQLHTACTVCNAEVLMCHRRERFTATGVAITSLVA